jgi:hypothetical protein
MNKLKEQIKKELTEIEEKGINASNLELVSKLTEIYKELGEIEKMDKGGQEMQEYGRYRDGGYGTYRDGGYNARGNYRDGGYNEGYGRRYSRMRDHMDRMMDGMDQYEYGKERYMHGGDDGRVMEGLEKIMYAICMFVETAMDFAESPQEKELIRKHIQKISKI